MCVEDNFSFNRDLTISHAKRSSQGVLICNQGDLDGMWNRDSDRN